MLQQGSLWSSNGAGVLDRSGLEPAACQSLLGNECAGMVIYLFHDFFFPFPLASSRNACVGLLISQVLQSGETHLSSGPKSSDSSLPWEAGRVFPIPLGVPAHAPGSSLVAR